MLSSNYNVSHMSIQRQGVKIAPTRPSCRCRSTKHASPSDSKSLESCKPRWAALDAPTLWKGTQDEALNSSSSGFRQLPSEWKLLLMSDGSVTRHLQLLTGSAVQVECLQMANIESDIQGLPPGVEAIKGPRVQREVLLRGAPPQLHPSRHNARSEMHGNSPMQELAYVAAKVAAGGAAKAAFSTVMPIGGMAGFVATETVKYAAKFAAGSMAKKALGISAEESCSESSLDSTQDTLDSGDQSDEAQGSRDSSTQQLSGSEPEGDQDKVPLVYACSWWDAAQVDGYLQDRSKPIWVSLSQGQVELYREVQHVYHGHNAHIATLLGCEGPFWGRQYFFWHKGKPLTLIYEVFSPQLMQYF